MLSKCCIYGLRASVYIAMHAEQNGYLSIRKISDELEISFHFLTKILQQLTEAGLLHSYRGPKGGVHLVRPASEISLYDIVHVLEGEDYFSSCILGLPGCGKSNPCPMHDEWARTRKGLKAMFEQARLDKLAASVAGGDIRLTDVPKRLSL